MQFKFTYKDQSGRVRYDGASVEELSSRITSDATMTKDKTNILAKYVYDQWKKLIQEAHPEVSSSKTPWSSRDYRADLLAGISKSVSGDTVSFKIEGDKALAAELGWGVRRIMHDWEDGIGNYADGAVQDLRPWLLYSNSPHVHMARPKNQMEAQREYFTWRTRSGALNYRVLRFDAPELSQMVETTAQHLTEHYDEAQAAHTGALLQESERRRFKAEKVKALTHTARSRLDVDEDGNLVFKPLDYSATPPSKNTHTYGEHMKWVYDRAALSSKHLLKGLKDTQNDRRLALNLIMQKAKFSVFRTITDSPQQIAAGLFFTKGIAPANTMKKLPEIIHDAIYSMTRGKNPDGSW